MINMVLSNMEDGLICRVCGMELYFSETEHSYLCYCAEEIHDRDEKNHTGIPIFH